MMKIDELWEAFKQYKHCHCLSEEEEFMREEVINFLEAEHGVENWDEGFFTQPNNMRFMWLVTLVYAFSLLFYNVLPLAFALVGVVAMLVCLWHADGRQSPIYFWGARKVTSNLVAEKKAAFRPKGSYGPLVILSAPLNTPPYFIPFVQYIAPYISWVLPAYIMLLLSLSLSMVIGLLTDGLPAEVLSSLLVLCLFPAGFMQFLMILYGKQENPNRFSSIMAALLAASKLWRTMPRSMDVRLVLFSGKFSGLSGSMQYVRQHEKELKERPVYMINIDGIGADPLHCVASYGFLSEGRYYNPLTSAARKRGIKPAMVSYGAQDSIWFARDNISAMSLTCVTQEGLAHSIAFIPAGGLSKNSIENTAEKITEIVADIEKTYEEN